MPELPEVETVVRSLRAQGLPQRRVKSVRVFLARAIAAPTPVLFRRRLRGRSFLNVERRGKWLVFPLDDGSTLLVHLRMTGNLFLRAAGAPELSHIRVELMLDDGRALTFRDPRTFGRWLLLEDVAPVLGALGPEPLDPGYRARDLHESLAARRRAVKPVLLDQSVVAGLGNIYVDESLWLARIHPHRPADSLDAADCRRLHRAIRTVLRRAIVHEGTSLGGGHMHYEPTEGRSGRHQCVLRVYGRTGMACPRCGTAIERFVVAQRGTHICPCCQPSMHHALS